MGFGDSSRLLKITFILLIIAVILQILGVALPYWVAGKDFNAGLWKLCVNEICSKIEPIPDWLEATQAFSIIGLLVLIVALVFTITVIFVNDKIELKPIPWILSFVAAFCLMIEFAVYAGEHDSNHGNFSGAFAITIIDFLLCIVIGAIGLFDWLGKGK